ncbi:hypothetical protein [Reinekea marinisedimentorum]|uniref:Putative ATP-grasp superfamily ATP-dependent carboligase n=1 Tax=Reinekea marinisedimentorum TaxID=230495 RepID=A0A4R3I686_9GAMM|nr:hypothetical protein [Reinekea marinisedimentorum]TCS40303.1 putative ATP-grasp superfamily ATP-dependent carboligase [Reinekea marinisedimentorum]
MKTEKIIIIANGINGLGAVRSAHQAGLDVITILTNKRDNAAYSRYASNKVFLPQKPTKQDLLKNLKEISNTHGKCSIICCSDWAAEWASELSTEIKDLHYFINISPLTVQTLNDKKLECESMIKEGVTIPSTETNLEAPLNSKIPLLIKPRTFADYATLGAKNLVISSEIELVAFRKKFEDVLDRFIGQEIITGNDDELWVCNVNFNNNYEMVSFFSFQRLGTTPSHYGVTSMALSKYNESLYAECAKIGKAIEYTGPAMIEFKRCPIRDSYFYIETNPRVGMCNWFDTRCGVNNVLYSHLISQHEETPNSAQRDNKLFLNLTGDIIARAEDREPLRSIAKLYIKHLTKPKVGATFYWKDPLPGIIFSLNNCSTIVKRAIRLTRNKVFKT